jgi:hypothetical protein
MSTISEEGESYDIYIIYELYISIKNILTLSMVAELFY